MTRAALLCLLCVMVLWGCRPASTPRTIGAPKSDLADNLRARQLLCGDIGADTCLAACPDTLGPTLHRECLLTLRFGTDPEALALARKFHKETKTLLGVDVRGSIAGFHGEEVALFPALPVGEHHRHHLAWLNTSVKQFDDFIGAAALRAPQPITFDLRPAGVAFFRTSTPSYPSAYCLDDVIFYNLDGPLHSNLHDMRETLFHELFHLNDARRGVWSERELGSVYASIVDRCETNHECFARFSPHDTIVDSGTYYSFDERTRDVREYAAELALRYFLEHERVLEGVAPPPEERFKCGAEENLIAWKKLADEFFGGLDLVPDCPVF